MARLLQHLVTSALAVKELCLPVESRQQVCKVVTLLLQVLGKQMWLPAETVLLFCPHASA